MGRLAIATVLVLLVAILAVQVYNGIAAREDHREAMQKLEQIEKHLGPKTGW
ncbi:MAG: hypothetical protein ACPHCI_08685 [Solirubrobacterales bacterium]